MKILGLTPTKLGPIDSQKILKGFFIGLTGAILTYVNTWLLAQFKVYVSPAYYPVMVTFWGAIFNTLTKLLDGQTE